MKEAINKEELTKRNIEERKQEAVDILFSIMADWNNNPSPELLGQRMTIEDEIQVNDETIIKIFGSIRMDEISIHLIEKNTRKKTRRAKVHANTD